MKKNALLTSFAIGAFLISAFGAQAQSVPTVSPWLTDSNNRITQRTANAAVKISGLSTGQLLTLDTNNVLTTTAGSGTVIPVATSTIEAPGFLSYWTSSAATPATLGKVATSSLTVNAPLTTSGAAGALVGGTSLTLGCTTAAAGVTGCLSGTDWSTFNSKQSALTFSTGLTNTAGTVTVNTSQNIATLSNLATNGFLKTSGGTGALSVDTSTYLTSAITALGPLGQVQSGVTQTFASSTDSTTGLTSGVTITASGNTQTFKPTLSGTLATTNGGTGATSISTGLTNSGSVFSQIEHPSFSYATSSWSGTTTFPIGVGYAQTWNSITCQTNRGTLDVDLFHGSSHTNFVAGASSTYGVITLSTNTSVTAGDLMSVAIGTPTGSVGSTTCTVADTL